ncbi:helix-turn-helix domain-containing protein [Spiroplasma alleghenense]|uniref:Insertion element IS150 protein InsJ-like helix-turn-helix domain-containing protein n=1 Tax=Spiroplasma alleghenense TaxID=216931 RepID=A0A345Z522_9MOLU|nr:helix-turn-helix domain-containing protein [Spiroplasma alleghenense]AXK50971.1 hypothetical protein SALLE_v1c02970 [Spiroplasma alleghenense]AXK51701.1 hypothetical protein SALLE_v1c10310 [Spiroplasma alleghenense]
MANLKGNKSHMTSFDKKLEIAQDWLQNQQSWKKLAAKYNVSYSAARKWALGYEQFGEEYLKRISSRKGQTAGISRIGAPSKRDKLSYELHRLKKKNKELEMENEFLKKFNQYLEDLEKNNK